MIQNTIFNLSSFTVFHSLIDKESKILFVALPIFFFLGKYGLDAYRSLSNQKIVKDEQAEKIPLTRFLQGPEGQGSLGEKISAHWLKDAATRVFHNPLRSFLELVVNSLDASLPPEKNVGKFGMGFISILTFLEHPETKGCKIRLKTTYENEGKSLCSYGMELFLEEKSYQVAFESRKTKNKTGTTITIRPKEETFSANTLQTLLEYCQALQFYEHGKIEVYYQDNPPLTIGEGKEVLCRITLTPTKISVKDEGSGISEQIAKEKLFVPSSSTKERPSILEPKLQLPQLVSYEGKKQALPHFLIAIQGVLVIAIPIKGTMNKDILLRMPPSTHLTVARNAIELSGSRHHSVLYLQKVIIEMLDQVVHYQQDPELLLCLYRGLQEWERQVPSVRDADLVSFMEKAILEILQKNPSVIPYPMERREELASLLPKDAKTVAFPSELLSNDFRSFEKLMEQTYTESSNRELINGKCVIFIEDFLLPKVTGNEMSKVSAFGMKGIIFAPLSLLKLNLTEKEIQFCLITQFADEGKTLFPVSKTKNELLPPSMQYLQGPKNFIFVTGRDTRINFDEHQTLLSSLLDSGFFSQIDDQPFEEFWQGLGESYHEDVRWGFTPLNMLIWPESRSRSTLRSLQSSHEYSETVFKKALSNIFYDGQNYWVVKDRDEVNHLVKNTPESELQETLNFNDRYFRAISLPQAIKLYFEWSFSNLGISHAKGSVFSIEKTFWPPPSKINAQYLQDCFAMFLECRIPKKNSIFTCSLLKGFQEATWMRLEPFLDYPSGNLAVKTILPLLILKERLIEEDLSIEIHQEVDLAIQQIIRLYENYIHLTLEAVQTPYGGDFTVTFAQENNALFKCSAKDALEFLISLKEKPDLFKKTVQLLVKELGRMLDSHKRDQLIQQYRIRTFSLTDPFSNNGFSLLITLYKSGIDPLFIEKILQNVKTAMEWNVICWIMLQEKVLEIFLNNDLQKRSKLLLVLQEVITVFLRERINISQIEESVIENYYMVDRHHQIYRSYEDHLELIVDYLQSVIGSSFELDSSFISPEVQKKLELCHPFTSIQIIHAAQKSGDTFVQLLKDDHLEETVRIVEQQAKSSQLQMINQAVEHGSERRGTEATLIEAFQNAVDAIRGYLKRNPQCPAQKTDLSFDVRIVQETEKATARLLLEIRDHIGMNDLKTLLADFLIPNFSEKSKDASAVGEMGNGSYQMYRDAEMVSVKTRILSNPSKVYFLRILPIRDGQTGEVVDLSHKCLEVSELGNEDFEGTEIRVLLRNQQDRVIESIEIEGVATRSFIQQTFSMAQPPLENNRSLNLKLKLPEQESVSLSAIETSDSHFQINHTPFTCYKMKEETKEGFVLTDGYPFKSLEIFLKEEGILSSRLAEEFSQGWCLNLPKGTYSPVQSRTRVQMSSKNKEMLKHFIVEWIYYRSFFKETTGPNKLYYPHFDSPCTDFSQVKPASLDPTISERKLIEGVLTKGTFLAMEAFFIHYSPSFMNTSFNTYINQGYQTIVPQLNGRKMQLEEELGDLTVLNCEENYAKIVSEFKNDCTKFFELWKKDMKSDSRLEQLFFKEVLFPWFEVKFLSFIKQIPSLDLLKKTQESCMTEKEKAIKISEIEKIMVLFSQEKLTNFLNTAKNVLANYCRQYADAISVKRGKNIQIDFYYNPKGSESAFYNQLSHKISINLSSNSLASVLSMGKKIANAEALQDDPLISFSPGKSGTLNHELEHARRGESCENFHAHSHDPVGNYLDFETCAAKYAHIAHQSGLMEKWSQDLQGIEFPTDEELRSLAEFEKINPVVFASLILNQ